MGITKEQQEVIEYGKGSLLVEAGPGSGKTFVIVNRILYLLENGVDPKSFLVITFTNKATDNLKFKLRKELAKKFKKELSEELSEENLEKSIEEIAQERSNSIIMKMQISTIHSFCLNYLKNLKEGSHKKYENLNLIDDDASERKTLFLKKHKKEIGFKDYSIAYDYHLPDIISKFDEYTSFNVDMDKLTEIISASRLVSQDYKDFVDSMDYFSKKRIDDYDKPIKSEIGKISKKMNEIKKELKKLEDKCPDEEVDDRSVEELKEKIEKFKQEIKEWDDKTYSKAWYNQRFLQILESYQDYLCLLEKYDYIDYNTLQLKALKELENDSNPPYKTVFVDEFQDSDFFDELKKIDSLEPLSLEKNFRSTENIVNLTEEFIRPQRESKKRKIHMESDGKCCNNPNFFIENKDEEEESANIYQIIKTLIDKGVRESDIAVLYRKHSSKTIANLVEMFKNEGINFAIKGQNDLKEQDEVKSIMALLWYITRDTRIGRIPSGDELDELNLKALCGEYFETSFFSLDDSTKEYLCNLQDSYYSDVIKNENKIYRAKQQDEIIKLKEELNSITTKPEIRKLKNKIKRLEKGLKKDKYSLKDISGVRGPRENFDSINEIFKDLKLPSVDIEKITNPIDKEFFKHLENIREEMKFKDSQTTQNSENEEEKKEPLTILRVFYKLIALSNLYDYKLEYKEIGNLAILSQTISNYETFIYDTDIRGAFFFLTRAIKKYDS